MTANAGLERTCAPKRPVVPITPPSRAVLAHNDSTFPFAMGMVSLVNMVDMMNQSRRWM